jgi:hypothetical protein
MSDYQDVIIERRITTFIAQAQPNFSLINIMFFVLVIAMIITAVGSLFSG